MKKIVFTKRQIRVIFRKIIESSKKMSHLPHKDEVFILDDALEYIMRLHTDRLYGKEGCASKHYRDVFENGKKK